MSLTMLKVALIPSINDSQFLYCYRYRSQRSLTFSDDGTKAMSTLCGVLHHRPSTECLSPASLENIAVLADKYDCIAAMFFWGQAIVRDLSGNKTTHSETGRLLYSAYTLDLPQAFSELCRTMVFDFGGSADSFARLLTNSTPWEIGNRLPHHILGKSLHFRGPM